MRNSRARGVVVFRLPSRRCNEVRWRKSTPAVVDAGRIRVRERKDAFTSQHGKKAKCPMRRSPGILFWRRPTLARPIAVLPSGLQRFTSVFGMGTGGATTLMSPERRSAGAARLWWRRFAPRIIVEGDWGQSPLPQISKELSASQFTHRFADIYIQVSELRVA